MPTLPLSLPAIPGAGELPVRSRGDVTRELPGAIRDAEPAPIRDALCDALLGVMREHQLAVGYAAAQSDVGKATQQCLDAHTEERGVSRASDEGDADLRSRLVEIQAAISRAALRDAINTLLTPHAEQTCRILEPVLDGWFVHDGTVDTWHSFVGASPYYPSRLYKSDSTRNSTTIDGVDPEGCRVFSDDSTPGRALCVLLPVLADTPAHAHIPAPGNVGEPPLFGWGCFAGDGTNSSQELLVSGTQESADAVYATIAKTVEDLIGHSIRWIMLADL